MREVILFHGEDGYWIAECPSLPGCVSQGKTVEEAMANIKEAIELYLEPDPKEIRQKKNRKVAVLNLCANPLY